MATIGERFNQLGASVLNLIGTRASRNMDNLSSLGKSNLQSIASSVTRNTYGNVCLTTINPSYTGTTIYNLKISGTFDGVIPAGKTTTGKAVSSEALGVTPTGTVGVNSGDNLPNRLTLFLNASGTTIARRYLVSYTEPEGSVDTVWYDLNVNLLKSYINGEWKEPTPIVGFKIGEIFLDGNDITAVVFDRGVQMLDAGTIWRWLGTTSDDIYARIKVLNDEIAAGVVHKTGEPETIESNKTFTGTVDFDGATTFNEVATFNKVIMGTAYRALQADIAEYYEADEDLAPGTLVMFGGEKELTKAALDVNGVVSTKPAYILNDNTGMEHPTLLVLNGRVPVRVIGPVKKFDKIILSDIDGVAKVLDIEDELCYDVIGRALEDNPDKGEKLVECIVKVNL